jgi:hypothetical protein
MRYRTIVVLIVVAACIGGCTTAANVQATAPSSTAPITLATTTMPPTPTSTSASPTTTVDRVTEVTRIFEDLERRRLAAIYSGDLDAFTAVYARASFLEENRDTIALVQVIDPAAVSTMSLQIVSDGPSCIAARIERDYSRAIQRGGIAQHVYVIERIDDAWGLSWVGEGWACVGPHPLG